MAGQPVRPGPMARLACTQLAHQVASVDPHRTTLGTQAGGGAAVDALVLVGPLQLTGVDTRPLLRLDIPPDHDPLPWRQGQAIGWAYRFAETAFDALVHNGDRKST